MTYLEFRNKYLGKKIDYDQSYGFQCVDLIKQYLDECYGIKAGAWGNAADYWENTHPQIKAKFDRLTPTTPKQGDILVFKRAASNGNAGHISIAESATQHLEQNGGAGTGSGTGSDAIRISNINKASLIGILRPKQLGDNNMPNTGDVDNAYLAANGRTATEEEKKIYTTKPWNVGDGLYYGKTLNDLKLTQDSLKRSTASYEAALAVAEERSANFQRICDVLGVERKPNESETTDRIVAEIERLKANQGNDEYEQIGVINEKPVFGKKG